MHLYNRIQCMQLSLRMVAALSVWIWNAYQDLKKKKKSKSETVCVKAQVYAYTIKNPWKDT